MASPSPRIPIEIHYNVFLHPEDAAQGGRIPVTPEEFEACNFKEIRDRIKAGEFLPCPFVATNSKVKVEFHCTRPMGHSGDHIAGNTDGRYVFKWLARKEKN